jgi:hypothetical protein
MKVLVCGGRDYENEHKVFEVLDKINDTEGISLIIQGGARGADAWGKSYADECAIPCLEVPADWDVNGKAAGFIRNALMLTIIGLPDIVVAFPGGNGTADMVAKAKAKGVPVMEVEDEGEDVG